MGCLSVVCSSVYIQRTLRKTGSDREQFCSNRGNDQRGYEKEKV